ncbi:hypothetical protein GCM10011487_36100 [Steroidobacter agaridevorans]|uniref:Uncharacterized protein n=1 Tax=Steroidobacter agaridevorans TaxID=2695856 RepID=A0A829YEF8_9GAMM|nr:hypothetical protein GCM10011487_36100 [Steroidobacter agaridevorans]
MHPAEAELVNVARRFAAVGAQVAQTFEQGQRQLRLDLLLSQERLCTAEGAQTSLAALEQLRHLVAAHKQAFSKFVTESSAQFAAVLAQLPPELQPEKQAAITASLNRQLQAQAEFYRAREQWMEAAEAICRLIDSRRASCTFSDGGIDFAADEDLLRFQELLLKIEAAHQSEVAGLQQRMFRLTSSLTLLG